MRPQAMPLIAYTAMIGSAGQTLAQNALVVDFDHAKCPPRTAATGKPCTKEVSSTLTQGAGIVVHIHNTQPDYFVYIVRGISPIPPPKSGAAAASNKTRDTTLVFAYDTIYGGYLVDIHATNLVSELSLPDASIIITVRPSAYRVDFGGAFTVSGLRDPAYALTPVGTGGSASGASYKIVEEHTRADIVRRGIATFVHASAPSWGHFAATFGLGIDNSNRGADYYLGPSYRLGDKGAFTTGIVFGAVQTPPPGSPVNSVVTDANILNRLGSRTTASWFLAISYSFLGGGQSALNRPFAGATNPAPAATTRTADANINPVQTPPPAATAVVKLELKATKTTVAEGENVTVTATATNADGSPITAGTIKWTTEPGGGDAPPNAALDSVNKGTVTGMIAVKFPQGRTTTVKATYVDPSGKSGVEASIMLTKAGA